MSGRIITRPWTRQPQGAARLDLANPLARGMDFANLSGNTVFAPGIPAPTSQLLGGLTPTPMGLAVQFGSPTSTRINWANPDNAWLRQQTFTRTVLLDLAPSQNGMIWNAELRADIGVGSGVAASAGILGYAWFDGTNFRYLRTAAPVSGLMLVDVVSQQGVGHFLYINGELVASDALTQATAYSNARDSGIGQRTTASQVNSAAFDLLFACNQRVALSASEIRERAGNIWQLFAPRRIFVPYSAAAPALPTLTALARTNPRRPRYLIG
jgi:hypothetical protein